MSDVTNNPARSRYELVEDGHTAFAEYKLAPGVIDFTHTLVPKELGGRGIGSKLAAAVLADANGTRPEGQGDLPLHRRLSAEASRGGNNRLRRFKRLRRASRIW